MAKRSSVDTFVETKPQKKFKAISKTAEINKCYKSGETLQQLQDKWKLKTSMNPNNIDISDMMTQYPYLLCKLSNFLQDLTCDSRRDHGNFITGLINELEQLKFHDKNNDLYQFSQSDDLKNFSSPYIEEFRHILEKEMLPWLRTLTDIELTDDVSMTCSKYKYTDRLLCHDDQLDCRRIAFIYYLVPPDWHATDGGTLDLFDIDGDGRPHSIVQSIVPQSNSFVFFEVSPKSFHQVSEVISPIKTRLSINGWFYGLSKLMPPAPSSSLLTQSPLEYIPPKSISLEILEEWINPVYLDIGVQSQIQQQFEEDSQIELPDFIIEEKFIETCKTLSSATDWKKLGPPDKRCIYKADMPGSPSILDVLNLFQSDPFCLLLSHITGLQLSNLYSKSPTIEDDGPSSSKCTTKDITAYCHGDILLWKTGCYTLMHPQNDFLLELVLHFNANDWTSEMGGASTYVLKNEDEELLSFTPLDNSLYLVYKDKHTLNYVQYLNYKGSHHSFHTLSMLYKEGDQQSVSDDENESNHSEYSD